jgi:hypothetical protein
MSGGVAAHGPRGEGVLHAVTLESNQHRTPSFREAVAGELEFPRIPRHLRMRSPFKMY